MKSIQNQYIDLREGRMSEYNFMRSIRMSLPQYVTNVTSFKDSIKILKNKGILNENINIEDPYTYPDDPYDTYPENDDNDKYVDPDMYDADGNDASEGKIYEAPSTQDIVKKYNEMFGKNPQTTFADVAKALNMSEDEVSNALFTGPTNLKLREVKTTLHPNQIIPGELRMGIRVEMEHTDDPKKAEKIALDHLAENPFYYTALKLSGVESPSAPKVKAPTETKKVKAAEVELVDKANAMKPVKGFEKAKASSNKAKKETNSGVKGVKEFNHNAQTVRGLQKFKPTGGKMKKVSMHESLRSKLELLIREVIYETYDGGDDMNPLYAQDEIPMESKLVSVDPKIQLLRKAKLLTSEEIHEILNDIATGWEGTVSNRISTELYNAINQADGDTTGWYSLKDTRWYKGGYNDVKTMLEDLIDVSKYISPKPEGDEWSAGENDPDHPNFDKAQAWGYEKRMHSED